MVIEVSHDRIVVGLRIEEWNKVYYEPIDIPKDLTTPDLAPDVGLYSHSRGEATRNEPMFGEVAWEPLLNHQYFPSAAKSERCMLQQKILYDAWRYLVAKDPGQIAVIREQLQSSHRQKRLLKELDKGRKARTNGVRQREKLKAKRLRSKNPDKAAKSIEKPDGSDTDSDDDSGLGSDTDDEGDDSHVEDDEDGWRMPPPSQVVPRRRPGLPYEPVRDSPIAGSELLASGRRSNSNGADSNAALSPTRRSTSAAAQSDKRKNPFSPGSQRIARARTEGRGLFVTPRPTGERPRFSPDIPDGRDVNGGLDYDEAIAAAKRHSEAPGEDGDVWNQNGGLIFDEAVETAMRMSRPPETGADT